MICRARGKIGALRILPSYRRFLIVPSPCIVALGGRFAEEGMAIAVAFPRRAKNILAAAVGTVRRTKLHVASMFDSYLLSSVRPNCLRV